MKGFNLDLELRARHAAESMAKKKSDLFLKAFKGARS
jgi:hypothetical protein